MKRIRLSAIILGAIFSGFVCMYLVSVGEGESISGDVTYNGKPVSGVTIYLVHSFRVYALPPNPESARIKKVADTGKNGKFRFSIETGNPNTDISSPFLVAYKPDFALEVIPLSRSLRQENLRLELERAVTVEGVVRDKDGKAIPGAEIRMRRLWSGESDQVNWDTRWPPEELKVKTDALGRYILPNLPPRTQVLLSAVAPGYSMTFRIDILSGMRGIDFTLLPEGRIEGTITFKSTGKPAEGVRVCLSSNTYLVGLLTAKTDSNGFYRISNIPPGEHDLSILPESGFPDWTARDNYNIEVNEGKTTAGVNFQLIKGGVITGKITEKESGKPISGVTVSSAQSSRIPMRVITDSRGIYFLRAPSGKNVYVSVVNPPDEYSFAYRDTTLKIDDGETVRGIDFSFKKGITLTGKALSPEGKPAAGVEITSDAGEMAWIGRAVSDSDGVVILKGVDKNGVVSITAEQKKLHLAGRASFRADSPFMVKLERQYTTTEVRGRIIDEEQRTVPGAYVCMKYRDRGNGKADIDLSTYTELSGIFCFQNAPVGEKPFLSVEAYGFKTRYLSLPEVTPDMPPLEDTVLLRTNRWIEGVVADSAGKPVEGAMVEVLTGCCREHVEARTNATGHFRLEGLMHLVEPLVTIRRKPSGYGSFRYVITNETHRFTLTDKPFVPPRDNSRFDWKKAEQEWMLFEGKPAPPLRASRWLNGGPVDLKDLRGKLVVLHFWSSNDQESVESLRLAESLHRRYGREDVCIIAVHSYTDDVEGVRKLLIARNITCRVAIDGPSTIKGALGRTFDDYKANVYPFPGEKPFDVLIDRTGRVNLPNLATDNHIFIVPNFSSTDTQNDIESKVRRMHRK